MDSTGGDSSTPEVARLTSFPYCSCDTYNCNANPYRMQYVERIPGPTGVVLRFSLFRVGQLGTQGLPAHAVHRSAADTAHQCTEQVAHQVLGYAARLVQVPGGWVKSTCYKQLLAKLHKIHISVGTCASPRLLPVA